MGGWLTTGSEPVVPVIKSWDIWENEGGSVRWLDPYNGAPDPSDVVFVKRFDSDFIVVGKHIVPGRD